MAGNWKMNCLKEEALALSVEILQLLKDETVKADVILLSPPFPYLSMVVEDVAVDGRFKVAAQNCSHKSSGAFTGEVAAAMIKSVGASYVILGHSERRAFYHESDDVVAAKTIIVLDNGLIPVFCCGESLAQRQGGIHFDVVKQQIETGLFHLQQINFEKVVIAYEPVWAIGTGETATPAQAQEMHHYIRSTIEAKYGNNTAASTSLLYGGSCNEKNATELFALPDVDGGLIGGASLKAASFVSIIQSFSK